jgi:hypothetical protein
MRLANLECRKDQEALLQLKPIKCSEHYENVKSMADAPASSPVDKMANATRASACSTWLLRRALKASNTASGVGKKMQRSSDNLSRTKATIQSDASKHAPASDFIKLGLLLQKFLTDCAVHADQNSPSFFLVRRRPQVAHRINLSGGVRFGIHKHEAPLTGDRHAADLHLHLEPSDASVQRIDHKRVCVGLECRFIAC